MPGTDGELSPISLTPTTRTWYSVPSFKPSTVHDAFVKPRTSV